MHEWLVLSVLALKASIILLVFALGLGSKWGEAVYLFREPGLLVKSILARNNAVPLIAVALIKAFSIHTAVAIAIAVLAVTPVPPFLPQGQIKKGARSEYVVGLLVSQSLFAIVLVPLTIEFMNWAFGAEAHFGAGQVAKAMFETVLLPLALGMFAAQFLPRVVSFAPTLLKICAALLVAGAIPLLLLAWTELGTLTGNGSLVALVIFIIASMAAGHILGGPVKEDRTTLAVASAAHHPGIALGIAAANAPAQVKLVAGAVVIYLILDSLLQIPYMNWRRRPSSDVSHPHDFGPAKSARLPH